MAVNLSPVGGAAAQFFDNNVNVLTGGKLYTYLAGTTTPAVTYTTVNGNVAWSNPIVLDAAGRVSGSGEIWLTAGVKYKFVLKDANDVLIATWDNISGINDFSQPVPVIFNAFGNGVTTVFILPTTPQSENSTDVYINGVYQQKDTYSLSGGTLTFSQAPPYNTSIEISYF